jgi:hypothetical protein
MLSSWVSLIDHTIFKPVGCYLLPPPLCTLPVCVSSFAAAAATAADVPAATMHAVHHHDHHDGQQ